MESVKKVIRENFQSFVFFYRYLRYRIFIALGISLVIGVLDSFGLAMFIPLLQLVSNAETANTEGLGNLKFIIEWVSAMGIELDLLNVLIFLCGFFTLKGIVSYFGGVYQVWIRQLFMRELRLSTLKAFSNISYKSFVLSDAGRIQNTFTTETERITTAFIHYFRVLNLGVLLLVYVAFAFTVDFRFALLVSVGGFLTNFFFRIIYNLSRKASRAVTKDNHEFQGLMLQYVTNYKYLKATGALRQYGEKIKHTILEIEEKYRKLGIYAALVGAVREPTMILIISAVMLFQTKVLNAPLAPIMISLLFFYRALATLNNLQSIWNLFIKFAGSLENMESFQEEMKIQKEQKGKIPFVSFRESLEVKNLSFTYGDAQVLKNINLRIHKNEAIAFVGESGSGKTTLISVLAGLLSPDKGDFYIDNESVKKIDTETYQRKIGFVTQDAAIFNDTIFNNVTFWGEDDALTKQRFWEALEQAAVADFVRRLPLQEQTILGNNGINLSGGQKQRLSIARELYKEVDFLFMDEATSALDSETERAIQENIDQLKGKYTILVIAHRLSTIKNADRVVLVKEGRIDRIGSYEELIKQSVSFRRMVELQEL